MTPVCFSYIGLFFYILCSFAVRAEQRTFVFSATTSVQETEALREFVSDTPLLKKVSITSDVYMSEAEKRYLTPFQVEDRITTAQLEQWVELLRTKRKFSTITLSLDKQAEILSLECVLESHWTFNRLIIKGISIGQELYHHAYSLRPGDIFDKNQHARGIERIGEILKQEGYFEAVCSENCFYDQDTKSVQVTLFIDRKTRFKVGSIRLNLRFEREEDKEDYHHMAGLIEKEYVSCLQGKGYTKKAINEGTGRIKKLLAQHGYLHADISLEKELDTTHKKIILFFDIFLGAQRTIVFFGNSFLSSSDLLDALLIFGKSVWLLPATLLAEELERIYKNYGFFKARITAQEELARSFFIIKEGERSYLKEVTIEGAVAYSQEFLIKRFFKPMLKKRYINQEMIKKIFTRITRFYQHHGFYNSAIMDYQFIPLGNNDYRLTLFLNEGPLTAISAIEIPGFEPLVLEPFFQECFRNKLRIPLTLDLLSTQRTFLVNYFKHRGYRNVSVSHALEERLGNNILIWHIRGINQPVFFGKTILQSSLKVPFSVIMSRLAYEEGQVWDSQKMRDSFLNLRDLDIFKSVRLVPAESYEPGQVPLLLQLEENERHELRVRLGAEMQHVQHYQTLAGLSYRVGGTFLMRNPAYACDMLRCDVDITRSYRKIVGLYRWPFAWSFPSSISGQLYSIMYQQPAFVGSNNDIYTVIQHGGLVAWNSKFNQIDYTCNVGFEWMKTSFASHTSSLAARQLAQALNFEYELVGRAVPFIFIEPTLLFSTLDNQLDPSEGMEALVTLKTMVPLALRNENFISVKFLCEYSAFIPLKPVVIASRLRFGHILNKDFTSLMPAERFYLGGSHSLRGYDTDLTPPYGIWEESTHKRSLVPRGGRTMANLNVELRVPLLKEWKGVVFQDMGILADNITTLYKQRLLAATGIGLRYKTPLGPLRFDIGFKWKRVHPNESLYAWFLTFGQAF